MATFGTLAVVGVGLIGGSIGRAAKARGVAARVVGVGRSEASLAEAVEAGAADEVTTDLAAGVAAADVVVVCTPVGQVAPFAVRAAAQAGPDVLITDAGSTKRSIVEAVERDDRARGVFVGGHPLAGSEKQGARHADPDLFVGRVCVLTPTDRTSPAAVGRARAFWSGLGCRLLEMPPDRHDESLALTSHLPHAVAAALAGTVPADALDLAAGAYRDGTRVAGADAALWAGIFRDNRAPLLRALDQFEDQLTAFRRALEADDAAALVAWWDASRAARSHFRFETAKPAPRVPNED